MPRLLVLPCVALVALAGRVAAAQPLVIDGEVPDDGSEFFFVPFEVPAGTQEIEVVHDDLSEQNILDWGLYDPAGEFRGWGGGNVEPAIVGELAASRSYLIGPLPEGTWQVLIGKAKIAMPPALYHLEIELRAAATLPPQPERTPYVEAGALSSERRWYAGDFHVHSRDSGDARESMTLDEIAGFAKGRGLDFVALSDHNTVAQLDFIVDAQSRQADFLFVPSVEFTTYHGHANGIGATEWVDHKVGLADVTIDKAAQAFLDQGAIFSINHPELDLGESCIGCFWEHDLDPELIGAVEIATGGMQQGGALFTPRSIEFWDELCATGRHLPAIGGSDDHRAGQDISGFQSPIGDPTTMLLADALSVPAILDAIRAGRTVVKLQGPDDPMIELEPSVPPDGDTIAAATVTLRARITGGSGYEVRFVKNGEGQPEVPVTSDDFVLEVSAEAPAEGQDRWRVEVMDGALPRTVTSHVWLEKGAGSAASTGDVGGDPVPEAGETEDGCGCRAPRSAPSFWGTALMAALWLLGLRRRARL